jgi:carotenoid 1,2-hydratase
MTERGAGQVSRESARLSIGRSSMHWDGSAMTVQVDERCAPIPRRLRGRIRLTPVALEQNSFSLDSAGLHRWTPFAPCARVEVEFTEPAIRWSGSGYLDSNCGAEPLENAFSDWTWARASQLERTIVHYDVNPRDGSRGSLALEFTPRGARIIDPLPLTVLPRTGWRIARQTRADAGYRVRVVKTLEDAPFYSRSVLQTQLFGAAGSAIHESLNLDRFRAPWVQCLLPFRMPRIS